MGRRLGQHFLFDPKILDLIVDALDPDPRDNVVEIGAGRGTLTRRLAPRVGTVVAIETDGALATSLSAETIEGCTVLHRDALEVDWHSALDVTDREYKVIGNIPYAITSPLIDKALTSGPPVVIVFLMQQEVAERLVASAGSKAYGALTVGVQAAATVERIFVVGAGAFRPPPRVDSAVVRLTPLRDPLVPLAARTAFRRFVTGLFSQRRRQLGRAMRTVTGRDPEEIGRLLSDASVDPVARPEVLTPQEFVTLFDLLPR